MKKKVPVTGGWKLVCPGVQILPDRYLWLECGRVHDMEWWRMVITDGSAHANAIRTGLTIWEDHKEQMSEAAAKRFLDEFEALCVHCPKRSRDTMGRVIWEALLELDRNRVLGGDLNMSLADQLQRLKYLSMCGETCMEVVMRMLVYTPSALGACRLETAITYATDLDKHRL